MKLEFVEIAGFRGCRDRIRFDLPSGFVVLTGRNGTGKSTVLDAIEFALTGTINKFSVRGARGGGLNEHIWWMGSGRAKEHYVSVGFVDEAGKPFVVTHSREVGPNVTSEEIVSKLCRDAFASEVTIETLLGTTLIRDETIASLSLDLSEQARFATVRAAIGGANEPDYATRAAAVLNAANMAKSRQKVRFENVQAELGRELERLTEARSAAARSSNVSEALRLLDSVGVNLPDTLSERTKLLESLVAEKRRSLRELERARVQAEAILPEFEYFASQAAQDDVAEAQAALDKASREKASADRALTVATESYDAEQSDSLVAHLSALLEHGTALGLQDGCCPLCKSQRTQEEFAAALAAIAAQLSVRGQKLSVAAAALETTRAEAISAGRLLIQAQARRDELTRRSTELEKSRASIRDIYSRNRFDAPINEPSVAAKMLLEEQQELLQMERALSILEGSSAVDHVKVLETRIATLRERVEQGAAQLSTAEKAVEVARQIEVAVKTVANQMLSEKFDTVMPLLKELYRRLRPHIDWREIEADFGGQVRASLNFLVGAGRNPQFLFSSGQRRVTGLAFLLAVHLSRQWCRWESLLLDDPIQHIDDYRALNLVEVLSAVRRTGRQILIAVEDTALADVLCRRLRSSVRDMGRRFDLRISETGTAEVQEVQDIYPMPLDALQVVNS
jgi:chromosome segregation protein